MLAGWWSTIEPGAQFVRTPSSGGWATPQLRGGFKAAGDLMTTSTTFCFTVEVKRREAWVLRNLYQAKPSPVWGWWKQACKAAKEEGRAPILFLRRNAKPGTSAEWFVMLPRHDFVLLVPKLDNWGIAVGIDGVRPMLTTWDALARIAPMAIIKAAACPVPVSRQALAATQASPKSSPASSPKQPRKARQRAAQAAASSPPGRVKLSSFRKATEEEKLKAIGKALAGFGPRSSQNSDQEPEPPDRLRRRRLAPS